MIYQRQSQVLKEAFINEIKVKLEEQLKECQAKNFANTLKQKLDEVQNQNERSFSNNNDEINLNNSLEQSSQASIMERCARMILKIKGSDSQNKLYEKQPYENKQAQSIKQISIDVDQKEPNFSNLRIQLSMPLLNDQKNNKTKKSGKFQAKAIKKSGKLQAKPIKKSSKYQKKQKNNDQYYQSQQQIQVQKGLSPISKRQMKKSIKEQPKQNILKTNYTKIFPLIEIQNDKLSKFEWKKQIELKKLDEKINQSKIKNAAQNILKNRYKIKSYKPNQNYQQLKIQIEIKESKKQYKTIQSLKKYSDKKPKPSVQFIKSAIKNKIKNQQELNLKQTSPQNKEPISDQQLAGEHKKLNTKKKIKDLGKFTLLQIIEQCSKRKIFKEEVYQQFLRNHSVKDINSFLDAFINENIHKFDYNQIKFTLLDHRRLCQLLTTLFPEDYQLNNPQSPNRKINQFLKNLYKLPAQDYYKLYTKIDQISKIKWWTKILIKFDQQFGRIKEKNRKKKQMENNQQAKKKIVIPIERTNNRLKQGHQQINLKAIQSEFASAISQKSPNEATKRTLSQVYGSDRSSKAKIVIESDDDEEIDRKLAGLKSIPIKKRNDDNQNLLNIRNMVTKLREDRGFNQNRNSLFEEPLKKRIKFT